MWKTFLRQFQKQQYKPFLGLFFLGLAVFFLYTIHVEPGQKYHSPDETANAFFARHFAETNSFRFTDPLQGAADGMLHPRSMRVIDDVVVPVSWLGFPMIYGLGVKIFGEGVLPFFTAALSVLSGVFVFALFRRLFTNSIAWPATLLWYLQPVFWFYNNRPLWNNTLFIDAYFVAWFFFVRWLEMKKWRDVFGFSFFLSVALITRTSEFVWVVASFILYWLIVQSRISWKQLGTAMVILGLCFLPVGIYQAQTYGSFLASGYTLGSQASSASPSDSLTVLWQSLGQIVFPFGIQFAQIGRVIAQYLGSFLAPWILLGFFGLLLVLRQGAAQYRERFAFAVSSLFALLYLLALYGSFTFSEYLDPKVLLFGSSYLRYLLPGLMLLVPFLAYAVFYFSQNFRRSKSVRNILLLIIIAFSVTRIFADPLYGLTTQREAQIQKSTPNLTSVFEIVEDDAVVLARDNDKLFWPERRVIGYNIFQSEHQRAANQLSESVQVYAVAWGEAEAARIQEFAKQSGHFWKLAHPLEGDLALYQLVRYTEQ